MEPQRPRHSIEPTEARYANYFEVGHNAYEFILDLGQYQPHSQNVQLQTRVVMGPVFAKLFCGLLTRAVAQFEQEHGLIQAGEDELDPLELVRQSLEGFDQRSRSAEVRTKGRK